MCLGMVDFFTHQRIEVEVVLREENSINIYVNKTFTHITCYSGCSRKGIKNSDLKYREIF